MILMSLTCQYLVILLPGALYFYNSEFIFTISKISTPQEGKEVLMLNTGVAFKSCCGHHGSRPRHSTFTWNRTFPLKKEPTVVEEGG